MLPKLCDSPGHIQNPKNCNLNSFQDLSLEIFLSYKYVIYLQQKIVKYSYIVKLCPRVKHITNLTRFPHQFTADIERCPHATCNFICFIRVKACIARCPHMLKLYFMFCCTVISKLITKCIIFTHCTLQRWEKATPVSCVLHKS